MRHSATTIEGGSHYKKFPQEILITQQYICTIFFIKLLNVTYAKKNLNY